MVLFLWGYQHYVTHIVHTSLPRFVQHDLGAMIEPVGDLRHGGSCPERLPTTDHDLRIVMLYHQEDSFSEKQPSQE